MMSTDCQTIPPLLPLEHLAAIAGVLSRPCRVLEWGAGGSTILLSQLALRWVAVEHDPAWADAVRSFGCPAELVLASERNAYVAAPAARAPYDVIIVDGRWRSRCLRAAHGYLAEGGVVALHDAERPYYAIAAGEYETVFEVGESAGPRVLRVMREA